MPEYAHKPACKILVSNADKTADFTPYLLSLSFEDHRHGESDTLTITLEDAPPVPSSTDVGLWLTPEWHPQKGAQVEAWLGYEGDLLHCGIFEIDEITITDGASGTTVSINALAAPNQKDIRTPRSKAHSGRTFKAIAEATAAKHGLSIVGEPPPQALPYAAQVNETDLAFLHRMAALAGAVFTVKGEKLIFHDAQALAKERPILVIKRQDIESATFSDKVKESAVSYSHFNGDAQENIETEDDGEDKTSPDKLRSRAPVKDAAQQRAAATARSKASKATERTASIDLEGNTLLVAGGLVELQSFGVLDGIWAIEQATHSIDASAGYKTSLELKLP